MKFINEIKANPKLLSIAAISVTLCIITIIVVALIRNRKVTPLRGTVTAKFGENRGSYLHNGTDIATPTGTPIRAPWRGEVVSLYTNATGGNQLLIEHSNGIISGYAHLEKYNVKMYDKVGAGAIIATTGNTGHSTGPHLHFTLSRNGKNIDPEIIFKFNKA